MARLSRSILPSEAVRRSAARALAFGALVVLLAAGAPVARASDRAELHRVALEHYDADFLSRARAYHVPLYAAFFVRAAVVLGAAWVLAAGPLGRWSPQALGLAGGHHWLARLVLVLALHIGLTLLTLPFTIWRYLHVRSYGLRHDSWGAFLADWGKGVALNGALVAVVALIVLACVATWPRWGWAVASAGVALLAILYAAAAPLVIDPLFNKFTPLADRALEVRLLEVARAGGVPAREVLVADASRRTRTVNAYFTGFGDTRRIVVYDTLLEKFPPDEVTSVVAHEVGHWKHHDVNVGLALGLAAAAAGLFLGQGVLARLAGAGWRGLRGLDDPALVFPAYALYVTLSLAAVIPSNWISRRMETRADRVSIELTGDPEAFVRTEARLGKENLSDVVPPAWIEATLYTHPATARRIRLGEEAR